MFKNRKQFSIAGMALMLLALFALAGSQVATPFAAGPQPMGPSGPQSVAKSAAVDAPTKITPNGIETGTSYQNGVTAALRDIPARVNVHTGKLRVEQEFPLISVP